MSNNTPPLPQNLHTIICFTLVHNPFNIQSLPHPHHLTYHSYYASCCYTEARSLHTETMSRDLLINLPHSVTEMPKYSVAKLMLKSYRLISAPIAPVQDICCTIRHSQLWSHTTQHLTFLRHILYAHRYFLIVDHQLGNHDQVLVSHVSVGHLYHGGSETSARVNKTPT